MNPEAWIANRCRQIELSGIRRVFELGKSLNDPVNLSIGQPHFEVPTSIRQATISAINAGHNGYTVTQGIPELREKLQADLAARFPGQIRDVLVTSGTSGGLLLALFAVLNPGEEVITPDPYFVAYPHMVTLAGGRLVTIDTSPSFQIDIAKLTAAITPRTKVLLLSSPSNPTGVVIDEETQIALVQLARRHGLLIIADEIYRAFHYDAPARSLATHDPNVLVIEGFGKTYAMTGWRLGWAHGPQPLIDEMAKLQQFTYVCPPSMAQYGALAALDCDITSIVHEYREKRNLLMEGLQNNYEFVRPGGAFYLFPKTPWGTGAEFVTEAIKNNLLVIPGGVFSRHDTHFRISYAATNDTIQRGIEILTRLARKSNPD